MAVSCANFIKSYLPASFKGVPLHVTKLQSSGGRRGVLGEFPFAEKIDYVDLGRKAETFIVTGMFHGAGHLELSRLLKAACSSPGPGIFIHPTLGVKSVSCTSFSIDNGMDSSLNITDFTLNFQEAPSITKLEQLLEDGFFLDLENYVLKFMEEFQNVYSYIGSAWYARNRIMEGVKLFLDFFKNLYISYSSAEKQKKWTIVQSISDVNVPSLIQDAKKMSWLAYNSLEIMMSDVSGAKEKSYLAREIINFGLKTDGGNLENLFFMLLRINAIVSLISIYKGSLEEEKGNIESLIKSIDTILTTELAILDDFNMHSFYTIIFEFRIKVLQFFYKEYYQSKNLYTYNFNYPVPAVVAAWEIYGDASKENDILANNKYRPFSVGTEVNAIIPK